MDDKQIDQILKECAEAINENRDLRRVEEVKNNE